MNTCCNVCSRYKCPVFHSGPFVFIYSVLRMQSKHFVSVKAHLCSALNAETYRAFCIYFVRICVRFLKAYGYGPGGSVAKRSRMTTIGRRNFNNSLFLQEKVITISFTIAMSVLNSCAVTLDSELPTSGCINIQAHIKDAWK